MYINTLPSPSVGGKLSAMRIDLHVHSDNSSCSVMPARDILAKARGLGLDGVCITDHGSTAVLSQIREGFQPDGLLVLVGMEYTTPQGDYLVYGPVEDLLPGMDAVSLIDKVASIGGAVVAAHPYRGWRPAEPTVLGHTGLTAIEVVNGRNTDEEDAKAEAAALEVGAVRVAGSDAHSLDELAGFPTDFTMEIRSRNDLVQALRAGACRPACDS